DAVREINAAIRIPLFVKLSRNLTSIPHVARQLLSGASGMVLFGRAPTVDLCLDTLQVASRWRLTRPDEEPESLGTLMSVHSQCPAMPLAASGRIGNADQLIKALMAGADVAMVTSAVYREGPDVIRSLLDGLMRFMESHHMTTMRDLQTRRPLQFSSEEERAAYIDALAAHLHDADKAVASRALHADRWGHPHV
ncbi:MAG: dihydroorotate dehydrogenase, partial [Planctomycetota bacterium]